jgi:hypothetical protein
MEFNQQTNPYASESTDKSTSELFTGKLPLVDALKKLRTRLLDLSSRNRLISYRHPKRRSIQFVDEPDLNLVFSRLIDGRPIPVKYVPDPPTDSYATKRPDVKTYAETLGIDAATEFSPNSLGSAASRHMPKLQTLYYPADLDKICRRMSSDARTVIEETGTNMLYLIFGFLEFYEHEDSEKSMLAPLIALPVTLEKGAIDQETRTYQYFITYSGEDINENQTLHEKLSQEFSLQLPDLEEEDDPSGYFMKIHQAVQKKKNWKIKHQLTLGFLSFGKLAIWHDLDTNKWPGLLDHSLLNEIFTGSSGKDANFVASDYDIDNHPESDLPVIFDADSSQHSAIIDVLSGRNVVINGPPGTGKSQTITNIIAAAIRAGKKILFVSEKLAALEVVRDRLNRANLGHFCLELHSHKTQKKKLLTDLQERINQTFRPLHHFNERLSTLKRHKKDLNRYAELMGSRVGNEIGLTIHQVFWRSEQHRQTLGVSASVVQSLFLSEAPNWTYDEINLRRNKLEVLAQLYITIGNFGPTHPWWGFRPGSLAPGDDDAIRRILSEATSLAEAIVETVSGYREKTAYSEEPSLTELVNLCDALRTLSTPPDNLLGNLLARIASANDTSGKRNRQVLRDVIREVERARELKSESDSILLPSFDLNLNTVELVIAASINDLNTLVFSMPVNEFEDSVLGAEQAVQQFEHIMPQERYAFVPINTGALETLDAKIAATAPLTLASQPIEAISNGASVLRQEYARLSASLERIEEIMRRRNIGFDGSPAAIHQLIRADGIEGLLPKVLIDDPVIQEARRAAECMQSNLPIAELNKVQHELRTISDRIGRALTELEGYARHFTFQFDQSQGAVRRLMVFGKVAGQAPADLLDYRRDSMARAGASGLLALAEEAHRSEQLQRERLTQNCYLDNLPSEKDLRNAISVFRRGDSLFNIFSREWRNAKALFNGVSKKRGKQAASDYATQLSDIVNWLRHRESFIENPAFKETFGLLFKGLETDFSKIRRLCTWYTGSHAEMLQHPGCIEALDLSTVDARKLLELANLSPRLQAISDELDHCRSHIRHLLDADSEKFELQLQIFGWREYSFAISRVADELNTVTTLLGRYVSPQVSPKRAVELLEGKREMQSVSAELEALRGGTDAIQTSVQHLLPGIISVSCDRWSDYLREISRLSNVAGSLADCASVYGNTQSVLEDIRTFLKSKNALDTGLEKVFAPREEEAVTDWSSYVAIAKRRVSNASELTRLLKQCAKPGTAVGFVLDALATARKAADINSRIGNDITLMKLFGETFRGCETDLDSLGSTVSWHESVSANITVRCSPLYPLLLSTEAKASLRWAKETLQHIADLHGQLKTKLNELTDFGAFNWDQWTSYNREQSKDELATYLLERNQVASHNIDSVLTWSKYNTQRLICYDSGLADFVDAVEQKKLASDLCGKAFDYVTCRSIGRGIYKRFPELDGFEGADHGKKRTEYATLDQELIGLTGKSFAYEIDKAKIVPAGNTGYRASELTELELLRRELGKQRRHLPIRQLIKRAGRAILGLKPCFMMGPMSVAQYLEHTAVEFDIVVMDEASQLRPEEALGAVARGKQLIVVGDPKQLPPTNFFDRLLDGSDDEDEDAPAVISGSESILDICQQLFHPIRTLRWHYRSQHESLIAFSNHHFYQQQLLIFPSPFQRNNRLGVRYRYVRDGVYKDRQNIPEAIRVVDAVIDHMLKHPKESLGVVTLNLTQRDLIEDLLDKKLRNFEEAQTFIENWQEQGWPFFVKNLENVQGDERDVIFISTTFGKAVGTDKVRQNFGPISRPDGWRRLNVLFTRARQKIVLFTSMLPEDIVHEANTPLGTRALKDYLDFAKRGVFTDTIVSDREPDSDFEIVVSDILRNRGYDVVPQLGVAGFFIDLAVRNPKRPGEFLAAIECDGTKYHSSRSARDRDRIRQTILEGLGWKDRIWRIWSTDWFYNPRRESERLVAFLREREALTASEPVSNFDDESGFEEIGDSDQPASVDTNDITTDPDISTSEEELYVEVGDSITYCFVDKPNERLTVTIVEGESNPQRNFSNENSPLAKALLNSALGDEPELRIKDNQPCLVRVLKIQRQQNLWNVESTTAPKPSLQPDLLAERSRTTEFQPINPPNPGEFPEPKEPSRLEGSGRALNNRIVHELRNLDGRFANPRCTHCASDAHLAIGNEGPIIICENSGCRKFERVDVEMLQRLSDRLGISCYQCKSINLRSQTGKFSNYLKCHRCDTNNSWQRISERMGN